MDDLSLSRQENRHAEIITQAIPTKYLHSVITALGLTADRLFKLSYCQGAELAILAYSTTHASNVTRSSRRLQVQNERSILSRVSCRGLTFFETEAALEDAPKVALIAKELHTLRGMSGEKLHSVFFIGSRPTPPSQYAFVEDASEARPLWTPNREGIGSIRVDADNGLLLGVRRNGTGRGTSVVAFEIEHAASQPDHLFDPSKWTDVAHTPGAPIFSISTPRSVSTRSDVQSIRLIVNFSGEVRRLLTLRMGIREIRGSWDRSFNLPYVVIGNLSGRRSMLVGYSTLGSTSCGIAHVDLLHVPREHVESEDLAHYLA